MPVVETIEESVLKMEQNALDNFLSRAEGKRIFGLRQELVRFQRIIGPMNEVCGRLMHLSHRASMTTLVRISKTF